MKTHVEVGKFECTILGNCLKYENFHQFNREVDKHDKRRSIEKVFET